MLTEEFLFEKCSRYLTVARQVYQHTGKKLLFLRGSNSLPVEEPITFRPRSRPMNTNTVIHDAANEYFTKEFGIGLRTNSVFVTTDKPSAERYGKAYYMVPIGLFGFYHSDSVEDMYLLMNAKRMYECVLQDNSVNTSLRTELAAKYEEYGVKFDTYMCDSHPELVAKYVEDVLEDANYLKNKISGFTSGNEIMVVCKQYMLVPMESRFKEFFDEVVYGV